MADFYFSYAGNKRTEIKEFIELVDLNKYDNIIEPFGGSLAFSRYIYNVDNTKNFFVCDINDELTYFCNNFYKNKDNIIKDCLNIINNINNKDDYLLYINDVKKIDHNDFLNYYLILRTYYCIREGLYPTNHRKPQYKNFNEKTNIVNKFFENVEYKCQDYMIYMEQFKDDEKALIFLDPPYINSFNDFYKNQNIGIKEQKNTFSTLWEYLYNFLNNCKCKFILIVNDNFFMQLAFSKWFYKKYSKIYQVKKGKDNHNIFTNIILN